MAKALPFLKSLKMPSPSPRSSGKASPVCRSSSNSSFRRRQACSAEFRSQRTRSCPTATAPKRRFQKSAGDRRAARAPGKRPQVASSAAGAQRRGDRRLCRRSWGCRAATSPSAGSKSSSGCSARRWSGCSIWRYRFRKSRRLLKDQAGAGVAVDLTLAVLPAVHDAAVVSDVRRRKGAAGESIVPLPAESRTLAEIIMAGADRRAARFRLPLPREGHFPAGEYDLPDPPEPGSRCCW